MASLERGFAAYTVAVPLIYPLVPALSWLHRSHTATYILKDAYLNALVSGVEHDDLGDLPTFHSPSWRRSSAGESAW